MNVALWIIAGLLAVLFLASGAVKLLRSKEKLAAAGLAPPGFGSGAINAIGVLEVLAAIGLVMPAVLGIAPVLVPVAAVGVALLMAGAIVVHLRRHQSREVVMTVTLLVLAVVVAWGRFGPTPFTA